MTGALLLALLAVDLYDLTGEFAPPARAAVTLYRVASPFTTSTLTEEDGRFTFRKLEPGAYTVAVLIPDRGEARQTVEVGPSNADSRRRVAVRLELKPSDFVFDEVARRRHSVSARQLGVPEKALREYEEAQKDLAKRDVGSAVERLERAVELAPQFATAWNSLGVIAYQTRNYPRAEECFRKALEQDPESFEPLVNLGGVLVDVHKLDEAWKYNVRAVLARPGDALANAQLGMTYFQTGNYDLAEKHLRKAVAADPAHFSHPQLLLAEIHLRQSAWREAAADLESFLKYHPDWPQAPAMREKILEWTKR